MERWLVLPRSRCIDFGPCWRLLRARAIIKKEIQKNPPINEQMIRAMYLQMGRKPSEADIRKIMNSMKKNSTL